MRKLIYTAVITALLATLTGCHRKPVYRPVEYVPDSLVHNDVMTAEEENQQAMDQLEEEGLMIIPDIPQESDLLQDGPQEDIEKLMREGF